MLLSKAEFIIRPYVSCLGKEKADKLWEELLEELGIFDKLMYETEEILAVCDCLGKKEGIISVIARCISARVYLE